VRDTAIILVASCIVFYCIVLMPSQSLSCTFFCSGLILSSLCTCQQERGVTLMIEAALQGQSETVEQLVCAGANVDSTCSKVMYCTGKMSPSFYLQCRYTYFVCIGMIVLDECVSMYTF
jgi:hypothetical protein